MTDLWHSLMYLIHVEYSILEKNLTIFCNISLNIYKITQPVLVEKNCAQIFFNHKYVNKVPSHHCLKLKILKETVLEEIFFANLKIWNFLKFSKNCPRLLILITSFKCHCLKNSPIKNGLSQNDFLCCFS